MSVYWQKSKSIHHFRRHHLDNCLELLIGLRLRGGPAFGLVPEPVEVVGRNHRRQLGLQGLEVHHELQIIQRRDPSFIILVRRSKKRRGRKVWSKCSCLFLLSQTEKSGEKKAAFISRPWPFDAAKSERGKRLHPHQARIEFSLSH